MDDVVASMRSSRTTVAEAVQETIAPIAFAIRIKLMGLSTPEDIGVYARLLLISIPEDEVRIASQNQEPHL